MNLLLLAALSVATPVAAQQPRPAYVAAHPDLNAFHRFADGGFDGNWYVGYNNAWIVRLSKIPKGNWKKAYLGARLGRAKTNSDKVRPWARTPIEGKINIAVSQKPAWSPRRSYVLADAADLPRDPAFNSSVDHVGEGRWFWVEVPLSRLSRKESNYLALWSPTNDFDSRKSAPILAAMRVPSAKNNVWLNRSIKGIPPRTEEGSLETPILNLIPAIAIKLIPANSGSVLVHKLDLTPRSDAAIVQVSASGTDIRNVWIESSEDKIDWKRISPFLWSPPYTYSISASKIARNGTYVRGAASDALENVGTSEPAFLSFKSR